QHVPVRHHVEVLPALVLESNPVLERPDVVAEVKAAGGSHAGEDAPRHQSPSPSVETPKIPRQKRATARTGIRSTTLETGGEAAIAASTRKPSGRKRWSVMMWRSFRNRMSSHEPSSGGTGSGWRTESETFQTTPASAMGPIAASAPGTPGRGSGASRTSPANRTASRRFEAGPAIATLTESLTGSR